MPNGWRTINSLVHKIRLHGRRGKGMAESFSRQKSRHAPQKEGGLKILCDLPPVWPRLVPPTNLMSRMDGKKTHKTVRKIPFAGVEPTSQRVRELRGTSELPGRRPCDIGKLTYSITIRYILTSSACGDVFVGVFFPFILDISSSLDVPAGVTQEEGHTGFLIHLLSAVRALIFLARRIQPFLSLVDRAVEFCVLTISSFSTRWAFLFCLYFTLSLTFVTAWVSDRKGIVSGTCMSFIGLRLSIKGRIMFLLKNLNAPRPSQLFIGLWYILYRGQYKPVAPVAQRYHVTVWHVGTWVRSRQAGFFSPKKKKKKKNAQRVENDWIVSTQNSTSRSTRERNGWILLARKIKARTAERRWMRNPVWPSSCVTPAGTSNELDVQNE